MRNPCILLACLSLAACGGDAPAAESAPPAARESAEQRAIDRRLRQVDASRRQEKASGSRNERYDARKMSPQEREKQVRDAMHAPVDSFKVRRVP